MNNSLMSFVSFWRSVRAYPPWQVAIELILIGAVVWWVIRFLRGTRGAERILETKQRDPLPLSLVPYPPGLVSSLVEGRREILLLKKSFNVFTNPNTEPLLDALAPDEIVVFGVATDVCDDAAIRGFLRRGRKVRFVEDAARGLDEDRVAACTTAWREGGVAFTTADEVLSSL